MSEEVLINVTPRETRIALVENGVVQELMLERSRARGVVGNLYKGRVQRVLPGMEAAFIDIGLERTAFLHASDIDVRNRAVEAGDSGEADAAASVEPLARNGHAHITELLREGEEVLVQVVKEPIGAKGARLTTQITVPSRYLVYLPRADVIGVSTRIEDAAERERLKQVVQRARQPEQVSGVESDGVPATPLLRGGFIVRTAAEGRAGARAGRKDRHLRGPETAVRSLLDRGRDPAGIGTTGAVEVRGLPGD